MHDPSWCGLDREIVQVRRNARNVSVFIRCNTPLITSVLWDRSIWIGTARTD